MRVLVACERFGKVRDAFARMGHDAISCDTESDLSSTGGEHYLGDVRDILLDRWDMLIAFPPCTHLAVSGARWFDEKRDLQNEAIEFFRILLFAPIAYVCIENPVGIISTRIRKPDQVIQPWQFGHGEVKKTCLWLRNLPLLEPTKIVSGRESRIHRMPPSDDRGMLRSETYQGIADAMADQWGRPLPRPLFLL